MVLCAQTLHDSLHADSVTRLQGFKQLAVLEQQGDEITHVIMREVAATFIIPFDREDIQALAVAMDDVADYLYAIAKRMELYKIHQIHPYMLKMSVLILDAAIELDKVVNDLRDLRYTKSMQESLSRIRDCEKHVGDMHGDAVATLFKAGDAIELLKLKEVFSLFYSAADKIEETGSVIETVLVKYS